MHGKRKMTELEEESDDWFKLKLLLAKLALRDIKEEWKVGNLPSTSRKIYEMRNIMYRIIDTLFIYLKEKGDIYLLSDVKNKNDLILEIKMLENLGINFDPNKGI